MSWFFSSNYIYFKKTALTGVLCHVVSSRFLFVFSPCSFLAFFPCLFPLLYYLSCLPLIFLSSSLLHLCIIFSRPIVCDYPFFSACFFFITKIFSRRFRCLLNHLGIIFLFNCLLLFFPFVLALFFQNKIIFVSPGVSLPAQSSWHIF